MATRLGNSQKANQSRKVFSFISSRFLIEGGGGKVDKFCGGRKKKESQQRRLIYEAKVRFCVVSYSHLSGLFDYL